MATSTHVREDIWGLATAHGTWNPVTLAYARAVAEMQTRPISDPTSWAYQGAMHGAYLTPPHGATWNQCQHASWFFLPWHRMYVYWFERIIRSIVIAQDGPSEWALPYWDYGKGFPHNTLPYAFREPALPNGSPNALHIAQRNSNPAPGINGGARIPPRAASHSYAFRFAHFTGDQSHGFGGGQSSAMQFDHSTGALENQPHNVIHDLVGGLSSADCSGGLMSDPNCAALDPIFWLHHSNIDRLWSLWIAEGGGRTNPADSQWLKQTFIFYDENRNQVVMPVSAVLDTVRQLGYTYDDQPPTVARRPVAAAMISGAHPEPQGEVIAASAGGVDLTDQPSSVDIALEPPARAAIRAVTQQTPSHVYLNVEGIDAAENPGVVYEIFLNLPQGTDSRTPDDVHFVGHVTFFSARHTPGRGERNHVGGLKHTFEITGLVQQLAARHLWNDDRVRVTFSPLGLLPPPGQQAVRQVEGLAAQPEPRARIGRVSIVRT